MSLLIGKEKEKLLEEINRKIEEKKREYYIAREYYVWSLMTYFGYILNDDNIDEIARKIIELRKADLREFNPDDLNNELDILKKEIEEMKSKKEVKLTHYG